MRSKGFIKGYAPGANITLLNTIYIRPQKLPDGKYSNDSIYIIFKDLDTGEKKFQYIESPEYTYYISNGQKDITTNMVFIEDKYVKPVSCKYRDLKKSIAELTGNLDFYYDNIKSGNYKNNDKLLSIPTVFRADLHVEDYYRFEFGRLYQNNMFKLSKMYLDIEVNVEEINGEFPDPGQCTVNAVSLVDESSSKVYTLLLRDETNEQIDALAKDPNISHELKLFVEEKVGGQKAVEMFGLANMEYELVYFDTEADLLISVFNIINRLRPDFVMAWNMAFDIPYLLARMSKLGLSTLRYVCPPEFPVKRCFYYVDHRTDVFAERGDFADIVSYTVYLDQLITYASRRKGQAAPGSHTLDYIGQTVAGVNKLDYSHITYNLSKLPRLDYKTFVFYNVMDTIVQLCIENRTGDVDFVFNKSLTNNTRYAKVHRQTVYLAGRANKEFLDMGYVLGNNMQKHNSDKEPYTGGFVQDPLLVTDAPKVKIDGRPVNIARNLNDFDYSSLYPNCIHQYNIGHNTMMGKLIFDEQLDPMENKFNNEIFNRSRWFIEDLVSGDYIDFCQRYLGLPGYEEMAELIKTYFSKVENPASGLRYEDPSTGHRILYQLVDNTKKRTLYKLVDNSKPRRVEPIVVLDRRPKDEQL